MSALIDRLAREHCNCDRCDHGGPDHECIRDSIAAALRAFQAEAAKVARKCTGQLKGDEYHWPAQIAAKIEAL